MEEIPQLWDSIVEFRGALENIDVIESDTSSVRDEIFGLMDQIQMDLEFTGTSDPDIDEVFIGLVNNFVSTSQEMSDSVATALGMSTNEWRMSSFARVGGPGTLGEIWEKLKEMRMVVGRKRKEMDSVSSREHSETETSVSDTSLLRRQIEEVRISSASSEQGQSPELLPGPSGYSRERLPSNLSLYSVIESGQRLRQGLGVNFERSFAENQPLPDSDLSMLGSSSGFAENQPLPDSDLSMPGLSTSESSSSSEEDSSYADDPRPWFKPEE